MFRYISKKLKFFIGGSNHKKSTLNHEASCKCECHNVDLEETKNEKIIVPYKIR